MIERFTERALTSEKQHAIITNALKTLFYNRSIESSGNGVFNFSLEPSGDQWSKFGGPVFVQVDINDERCPTEFIQTRAYGNAAREKQKKALDCLFKDFHNWMMNTDRYGVSFNPVLRTDLDGDTICLDFYGLNGDFFRSIRRRRQDSSLEFFLVDGQTEPTKKPVKKTGPRERAVGLALIEILKQPGVNKAPDGRLIKLAVNPEGEMRALELRSDGYWRRIDMDEIPEDLLEGEKVSVVGPLGLERDDSDGWTYEHQSGELNKLGGSGVGKHIRRAREEIDQSGMIPKYFFRQPSRGGPKDLTNPKSSRGSGSTRGRHRGRGKVPGGKRRF